MKKIFCLFLLIILFSGCSVTPVEQETTGFLSVETEPTEIPESNLPTEPTTYSTGPAEVEEEITAVDTAPQLDPAETVLNQMTLEEKVGQLFLVACPDADAAAEIQKYHFGGFVLFGKDVDGKTPDSLRGWIGECQQVSKIPMLFAVDEEGGSVCRVSAVEAFRSNRFSSPGFLYAQGGLDLLLMTETEKCELLKSVGINVNLAPVCDIATDPNAFMYSRSLRLGPEETADTIRSIVVLMKQMQVGSVLKHFPGYGNNTDTHVAMALDERTLDQLERKDLLPFRAGISSGADAIMVSHTIVTALDDQMPASLSDPVHTYLRENMGYAGVIITDDLQMGAITDTFGRGESAVLAVLAGNDLLCTWEYEEQYAAVLEAVQTGAISCEQLDRAVLRILRWKQDLGLLV